MAFQCTCYGQEHWQLKKQQGQIRVYQSQDAGAFKSVKVEAKLEGTTQKLIEILRDVAHNHDWVYATRTAYLLQSTSLNDFVYYAETALPWPMKNRDQPIHLIIHPELPDGTLKVTTIGKPGLIPPKPGLVRIPTFSGTWLVTTIDSRHININYYLTVDPGGSVPPWLVNLFVTKGPLETFTKLALLLKR